MQLSQPLRQLPVIATVRCNDIFLHFKYLINQNGYYYNHNLTFSFLVQLNVFQVIGNKGNVIRICMNQVGWVSREKKGQRFRKGEIAFCEIIIDVQFIHCYIFLKLNIIVILMITLKQTCICPGCIIRISMDTIYFLINREGQVKE